MTKASLLFVTKLHFAKDGNGGQQRTYFLIKELSKHYNLFVVSPYAENNTLDIDAHFIVNKAVYYEKYLKKNKVTRLLLKIFNRLLKHQEATKPIHQSNFATYTLKNQIQKLKSNSNFSHIQTIVFDTLSVVMNLKPNTFTNRILNAHNFDSELVQMNLDNKITDPNTGTHQIETIKNTLVILKTF